MATERERARRNLARNTYTDLLADDDGDDHDGGEEADQQKKKKRKTTGSKRGRGRGRGGSKRGSGGGGGGGGGDEEDDDEEFNPEEEEEEEDEDEDFDELAEQEDEEDEDYVDDDDDEEYGRKARKRGGRGRGRPPGRGRGRPPGRKATANPAAAPSANERLPPPPSNFVSGTRGNEFSSLHEAARHGTESEVYAALRRFGARELLVPDATGSLPLAIAAGENFGSDAPRIVKMLGEAEPRACRDASNKDRPLHRALCRQPEGNVLDVAQTLLKLDPEVLRDTDSAGNTPLGALLSHRKDFLVLNLLELLISTDPTCATEAGHGAMHVPLHKAAAYTGANALLIVRRLLSLHPAAMDYGDEHENTPFHVACHRRDNDPLTTQSLIEAMLEVNTEVTRKVNADGQLPLHFAAGIPGGAQTVALVMAANPVAVRTPDNNGRLPLHFARDEATVHLLLQAYAEAISLRDKVGNAPIHLSYGRGGCALLAALPEAAQWTNNNDELPLHCAVHTPDEGNLPFISALMTAFPAGLQQRPRFTTHTPLGLAITAAKDGGAVAVIQALMAAAPQALQVGRPEAQAQASDSAVKGEEGEGAGGGGSGAPSNNATSATAASAEVSADPPLFLAAQYQHKSLLIVQVVQAANPDAVRYPSGTGQLPLHAAASRGDEALLHLLLQAYPEAARVRDYEGNMPLHIAARSANATAVRILLEAYPEAAETANHSDELPLHLAVSALGPEVEECVKALLAAYPAGQHHRDRYGRVPAENMRPENEEVLRDVLVYVEDEEY